MHGLSPVLAIIAGLSLIVSGTVIDTTATRTTLENRADLNPTPAAPGDPTNGWQALPAAPSAAIHSTFKIGSAQIVRYPCYILLRIVLISSLASVSVIGSYQE